MGIHDDLKGQIPVGFVVLKFGSDIAQGDLEQQLVQDVRSAIGPVATFKRAYIVSKLPKTRSGKILRRTIRQIMDGEEPQVPATIEDRTVLDELFELAKS